MTRRARLVCAIVLAGCGARTALETQLDAAPAIDAGARDAGARDADMPDARTPDAGPPGACTLGPHTRLAGEAPGFAFSLVPAGDSFALGMSLGWPPDERAQLAVVPSSLDAIARALTPIEGRAQRVFAGDGVAAIGTSDNRVLFARWTLDGGITESSEICRDCFVESPPVRGPGNAAFVVLARPESALVLVPGDGRPVVSLGPFGGATSAVVGHTDDVWLIAGSTAGTAMLRFSWDGLLIDPGPRLLSDEPTVALAATSSGDGSAIVALRTESGRIGVLEVGRGGMLRSRTIAVERPFAYDLEVSVAERTIAVGWSELAGSGQGVHVAVLERPLGALLLEPTQVVADGGSYTVTSTIAPHPLGHAIAWGGWQRGTNYGVYATLLTCP